MSEDLGSLKPLRCALRPLMPWQGKPPPTMSHWSRACAAICRASCATSTWHRSPSSLTPGHARLTARHASRSVSDEKKAAGVKPKMPRDRRSPPMPSKTLMTATSSWN
eukprot:8188967-Lingulodinium_polyedra.AAC.1